MTDSTILRLSGMGIPPYSARGITQVLAPIVGATQVARTVNGELIDLAEPVMQKYATSLFCTDQEPPAVEGVWPGKTVTVDCIVELAVQGSTEGPTELLGRDYVEDSIREADGFVFYRPRLVMKVLAFAVTRDEWGAVVDWRMDLEEV